MEPVWPYLKLGSQSTCDRASGDKAQDVQAVVEKLVPLIKGLRHFKEFLVFPTIVSSNVVRRESRAETVQYEDLQCRESRCVLKGKDAQVELIYAGQSLEHLECIGFSCGVCPPTEDSFVHKACLVGGSLAVRCPGNL